MFALESPAVWLGHGYLKLVAAANSGLAERTAEGTAGGEILGQVAEPDETRQAITFLVVCLIGIALLLAALTVWYWQFTSPKRRADALLSDLGHYDPGVHGQSRGTQDLRVNGATGALLAPASPPAMAGQNGPTPAPDHLRMPAPAPAPALAPAIDDRTTSAPAFAATPADPGPADPVPADVVPSDVVPSEAPPVAPPALPTKTARRSAAVPAPVPGPTTEQATATPRRIEVAARAVAGGHDGRAKPPVVQSEPIFPDRAPKPGRSPGANPVPPPVESKTGTAASALERGSVPAATSAKRGPTGAAPPAASMSSPVKTPPSSAGTASGRPARPSGDKRPGKAPSSPVPKEPAAATAGQEGLSDDDWAAVMQSAFSKLNK